MKTKQKSTGKPTFVTLRDRRDYGVAINTDDLKTVVINAKQTSMTVETSNHELPVNVTPSIIAKLMGEIRKRYHIVTLADTIKVERATDAKAAIVIVQEDKEQRLIWPRALNTFKVIDGKLELAIHGMETKLVHNLSAAPSVQVVTDTFALLGLA